MSVQCRVAHGESLQRGCASRLCGTRSVRHARWPRNRWSILPNLTPPLRRESPRFPRFWPDLRCGIRTAHPWPKREALIDPRGSEHGKLTSKLHFRSLHKRISNGQLFDDVSGLPVSPELDETRNAPGSRIIRSKHHLRPHVPQHVRMKIIDSLTGRHYDYAKFAAPPS
jgi:hypothetical protein